MMRRNLDAALRFGVACGLAATVLTAVTPTARALAPDTEHQLTTNTADQAWPEISGKYVVFSDYRDVRYVGDPNDPDDLYDIRVLNLNTGKSRLLTPAHTAVGRAAISGNRVVWPDYGTRHNGGIWYHNLATGTHQRIRSAGGAEIEISGRRLCYERNNRIWVYDLRTKKERAVSPKGGSAGACDISGSVVVWQDFRNGNHDIYSFDLNTGRERQITTDGSRQTLPKIGGGRVVWIDDRNGILNDDIYAYDLKTRTELQVTSAAGTQWFPNIANHRVVWMDERNGSDNTEVYAYDFDTGVETRVSDHEGWSGNPVVSGARIVWSDSRDGDLNLYLRALG